jgi:citrate lyase beta subunit
MKKFPITPIFIPANKLNYIEKAIKHQADGIIFDLEDAVPISEKETARKNLFNFLSNNSLKITSYIRINDLNDINGRSDLNLFKSLDCKIIIPKIETKEVLKNVPDNISTIPLIETPLAIKNLEGIASSSSIFGLMFGAADYSAAVGSDMSWEALLYARSKIIIECAINNLFSIDSPFMITSSQEELERECKLSKSIGFNSKAAINPSQINVIKNYFLPTDDEIMEAQEIIKEFNKSEKAVFSFNGKMIDKPIIRIMENRLKTLDIK